MSRVEKAMKTRSVNGNGEDTMFRRLNPMRVLGFSCGLAMAFAFVPAAQAALFTVNCAALNGPSNNIKVIQPADDVVVNCSLEGATVLIQAHSILVDASGANSGAIKTTGTDGIKLQAGLDSKGNSCTDGSPLSATIDIRGATLEDQNNNGGENLKSCWDITVETGSSLTSAGANVRAECLNLGCSLKSTNSNYFGNRILLYSQGDMTLINNVFTTIGPRDQQTFVSYHGSLKAGEGCDVQALLPCPDPFTQAALCQLCQECHGHNSFSGGVESNFFAFAEEFLDLSGACINIAENITITADARDDAGNTIVPPAGPPFLGFVINIADAEIRDDFGKTGFMSFLAHPPLKNGLPLKPDDVPFNPGNPPQYPGDGSIWYDNAVLVDDGKNGGGVDPQAVAFMNGYRDFIAGDCSVPVGNLNCSSRPIPARGSVADPAQRINHNVSGIPRCDS